MRYKEITNELMTEFVYGARERAAGADRTSEFSVGAEKSMIEVGQKWLAWVLLLRTSIDQGFPNRC